MNLYQFVKNMERISLLNNGVVSFAEGDVYELMNNDKQTYPKVVLTLNNITDAEEGRKTIDCTLFYIDRLTDNGDNKISIQSVGITVLDQIKTHIEDEFADWDYTTDQFTPFTEKFADLCAGVFTSTTIELSLGDLCTEEGEYKEKILQIYHPGTYDVTSYTKAEVLYKEAKDEEAKEVTITENGETTITPTSGNLLSSVKITTNVPQNFTMTVPNGVRFGYSYYHDGGSFDLSLWDFSQVTSFDYMFSRCRCDFIGSFNDTSKGTNFREAFVYSLITTIPTGLDLTNAIDVLGMFGYCEELTSVSISTSQNAVNMRSMFYQCPKLTSVSVYCNSAQTCQDIVYDCLSLKDAQFVELGRAFTSDASSDDHLLFIPSEVITFTGLEDLIGSLGFVPSDVSDATIQFKSTVFNKLTANQKNILAWKNWNVQSI